MKRKLFAWMMAIGFAFTNVNSFVFAEEETEEPAATEETSQEETIETETPEQTGAQEETVQDNEPEKTDTAEEAGLEEEAAFDIEQTEAEYEPIEEIKEEQEQDYSAEETDVISFEYTNSDGKITITKYKGSDMEVVIPSVIDGSPVTSIGNKAFFSCTELTSITIPDSVTSIGRSAFENCSGLTSLIIPDSVTDIGYDAFSGCTGLKTAGPIGGGYNYEFGWKTSIPANAFSGRSGLTSLTFPDGVTSIGRSAFSGCTGLTSITIPDSVTDIGYSAFDGCTGLTNITIPEGVTSIGYSVFSECTGLSSITIPDSVTSIGSKAFYYCTGLTSITIPDSVTSIGDGAFSSCKGLTSIIIPGSVTSIGDSAFSGCSSLTSITISDGVKSIGNEAFNSCTGLTSVTIPDSVIGIGEWAFCGCSGLTSITIPDSVTFIGDDAFDGCSGITSITIPDSVTDIGYNAFSGFTGLKTAGPIGGGYDYEFGWKTSIPAYAFSGCSDLISITIPDSVTDIGYTAFSSCSGLTSITIPNSVNSIDRSAFIFCNSLKEVRFDGTKAEWNKIKIESDNDPLLKAKKIFLKTTPTSISIAQGTSIEMPTNSNKTLKIKPVPADASGKVTWVSSNKKAAEIDENGIITAKTYGKTTITATSVSNPKLIRKITVQTRFYDVNDSTQSYYKPVYWGADNGVVAGYDGGVYFGPDNVCTRAQFVTFLWRLAGKPEGKQPVNFKDIDPSVNYYRAVKWAVSEGIIVGYKDDNTFRPDNEVTRGQVAVMLWRYAGKKTPPLPKTSPFSDIDASNSSYRAVVWGQKAGVIKGYKTGEYAGQFRADDSCLRQHIVTFLYRYARDVMKKKV